MVIVNVRHPVPYRFVPHRGRSERLLYSQGITPVELRELDPRDVRLVARIMDPELEFHAIDGALWLRPRINDRYATAEDIVGYLEKDIVHAGVPRDDFLRHFLDTPLCVREPGKTTRGLDMRPTGAERILEDGSERAARQVRAFVAREVAVCGGQAFLRCPGPLLAPRADGGGVTHHPFPRADLGTGLYCRMDRLADLWRFMATLPNMGRAPHQELDRRGLPPDYARIPAELLSDDDIVRFANRIPAAVKGLINAALVQGLPEEHEERVGLRAEALSPHARDGRLGYIGLAEAEAVLPLARDALTDLVAAHEAARVAGHQWLRRSDDASLVRLAPYIDGFLLPRLREHQPVPREDAEAFEGIAPGAP